jgi:nucleoside-diphosphate-sugar epimerase
MTRPRIGVTGAGGFVGRHVVEELVRRGYTVEAAVGRRAAPEHSYVHTTRVDLLDPDAARRWVFEARPDRLLHAAWYAVPGKYWTSPENERWLEASRVLFSAALDAGCQRIIGIGSCAEYVWDGRPCSEARTPIRPATPYGRAKDMTRAALAEIAAGRGASWAWARLFFLFGPHEPPSRLVPSVVRSLLQGEAAACTEGGQERDFLFVRDAASALVALLESGAMGPVNVASGQPIAVRMLVQQLIARVGTGRALFGALPMPPDEPACLVADVTRLRDEVGWTSETALDDAIDRSIAFERERMHEVHDR